jgi:cytoplasmic tRNA 2-thiolation protein 1
MAKLVPGSDEDCGGVCGSASAVAEEEEGGCGSSNTTVPGGEMAGMERRLEQNAHAAEKDLEVEITVDGMRNQSQKNVNGNNAVLLRGGDKKPKAKKIKGEGPPARKAPPKQVMGSCKRCGYLSSQEICKACVLLEGLNKSRPKNNIEVGYEEVIEGLANGVKTMGVQAD